MKVFSFYFILIAKQNLACICVKKELRLYKVMFKTVCKLNVFLLVRKCHSSGHLLASITSWGAGGSSAPTECAGQSKGRGRGARTKQLYAGFEKSKYMGGCHCQGITSSLGSFFYILRGCTSPQKRQPKHG